MKGNPQRKELVCGTTTKSGTVLSSRLRPIAGGLNHLPYLLSILVSMAVIKDFSTNYMKALGLNQAYMLKLRIKYYIVLIWIDNGKYITTINKKFIVFSLFG